MVLFVKCYVVFHFLMFYFQQECMFKIIQLGLGNRVANILGKGCQLCLPSVHFVAASLYLSVFTFGVGG